MSAQTTSKLHIIGGGLAGCEAAMAAANLGVPVILHEMRGPQKTFAHQTDTLAELVCSNSLRSDDATANAVGVLHEELRRSGSVVMRSADQHKVPAGSALAVDREGFADQIQNQVMAHPLIDVQREEIDGWPPMDWQHVIIATGPLTSSGLAGAIQHNTGQDALAFFDAIAPIVYRESINFDIAWFQSRYDKAGPGGTGTDYINCPMTEAQYEAFIDALIDGEKTEFKEWEKNTPYFDACLPIEVMAERGRETLRFGPMKPVGLTDPRDGSTPHAVVQLRQDDALGTLFNIVGFQTKLKYQVQKDIFRLIPGLEGAEFARLGGIHRNSFIKSPILLDDQLRLKSDPRIRFAGQITGVEGYVESAATGLLAGRLAAAEILGMTAPLPAQESGFGALLHHVTGGANADSFQPMNVNFGLMPPPPMVPNYKGKLRPPKGFDRKKIMAERALQHHDVYEQQWQDAVTGGVID